MVWYVCGSEYFMFAWKMAFIYKNSAGEGKRGDWDWNLNNIYVQRVRALTRSTLIQTAHLCTHVPLLMFMTQLKK